MKIIQDIFVSIICIFTFVILVPIAYETIGTYNYVLDYFIYALTFRVAFQYSFLDLRKDITFILLKIPNFYTIHDVEVEEVEDDK